MTNIEYKGNVLNFEPFLALEESIKPLLDNGTLRYAKMRLYNTELSSYERIWVHIRTEDLDKWTDPNEEYVLCSLANTSIDGIPFGTYFMAEYDHEFNCRCVDWTNIDRNKLYKHLEIAF